MGFSAVFLAGAAVSVVLGFAVRRTAIRAGAVVAIRPDRWHRRPTPTFGGVAIVGATIVAAVLAWMAPDTPRPGAEIALVAAAAAILFLIGFLDDHRQVAPLTKLAVSIVAGTLLVAGLALTTGMARPWWQGVMLVLWYAGVVNAFNLIDNMDGLAGGVTLVSTLALAALFGTEAGPAFAALLAALAGSAAGFLVWNAKPARLFMGDCGSLFIGALLAGTSLALLARPDTAPFENGLPLCLVFIVPLLDATFVFVLRRFAGRSATTGGTDHLSHRLVTLGLSERAAVAALYGLGAAGAAAAWFVKVGGAAGLVVAAAVAVVSAGLAVLLAVRAPYRHT